MPINGYRKLAAFAALLVVGLALVHFYGDVPEHFLSLLQLGFGTFVAGNALEHVTAAYTNVNTSSSAPAPDSIAVEAKLQALEEHDKVTHEAVATVQNTLAFIITKTGLDKAPPQQGS